MVLKGNKVVKTDKDTRKVTSIIIPVTDLKKKSGKIKHLAAYHIMLTK